MTRIALLDVSGGTATAVRAALGADVVVECHRGAATPDADLVIAEPGSMREARGLPDSAVPLLLLVAKRTTIDPASFGDRAVAVLKKPFDLIDLRHNVRALLECTVGETENPYLSPISDNPGQVRISAWLGKPWVAASVVPTLAAACRLRGPAWIVGEAGTGTDHVAAALALAWDRDREPVVWDESDSLASALSRLGDPERVLWVPALDERPIGEQRAFERFLALEPERRVAVTSGDEVEAAVLDGTLLRSLHDALARVSLRLAPLRERRGDIAGLAVAIGSDVAAAAFGAGRVLLSDDATRVLETYPWPGNLAELTAVVTRSVIAAGTGGAHHIEPRHLHFAPAHFPENGVRPLFREDAAPPTENRVRPHFSEASAESAGRPDLATPQSHETSAPRRAVVVALGDMAAARAARPSESTSTDDTQPAEHAGIAANATGAAHAGVESLLAAFAHDIRNPMSTIKTFAGLQAASAGDDTSELARLAIDACDRVDEHLEFLQSYAELTPSAPTRIDMVDLLGEAVDAAGAGDALTITARRSLWVHADPALARFVATAIVAECRSRGKMGSDPIFEADVVGGELEVRMAVGGAAVDRLGKWVEGASLPWRLALARDAARRSGGELQVDVEDGLMRLRWRLPQVEEGKHDDQAGSPDRRRRSRSS
ncbi:MAG: hypothetical protein ABR587_11855 [Candidatus Binatia bacterium]